MAPDQTTLHVIRTGRDSKTNEPWIEKRAIQVIQSGRWFWPSPGHTDEWKWAFGDKRSIPDDEFRLGYTRYYNLDNGRLYRNFLESRTEAVETAKLTLERAREWLEYARTFVPPEVVSG